MIDITTATFDDEVFGHSGFVLVDFWATWCGPCKSMAQVLEQIEPAFAEEVKFAKVECVANPDLAESNNVRSLPTLLLFQDGFFRSSLIGAGHSASQLSTWLR